MPISSKTISELKNITAQFDFLFTASNVKIETIPNDHQLCVICQEPFNNNAWKFGDTVNCPVKLECGHIFGIQCLAHLVFTSDFSNRCPLCRAQVISASFEGNPSGQSWKAAVPLLRILMIVGRDRATFAKKKALDVLQNRLEREGLVGLVGGKHVHRIMVLYEEFLNQFCDQPQPVEDADRLTAAEARVQELRDVISETQERRRQIDEAQAASARLEEAARQEREKELKDVKGELEEVKKRWEETKSLKAMASSIWVFVLVVMTTTAVLVHFEGHVFDKSTSSMAVLGMWIVHCVVAVIRSRPSRKSWMIFGLVLCCVLLGVDLTLYTISHSA
ncbi:MAG: hypothetical protein Q9161_006619 [Pseudevernia consocians]